MAAQLIYTHDPDSTRDILQALPDWFGDPEALENYVRATADETFSSLLALEDGTPVGVALIRRHFPESAELHLIAVHPESRGRGIGRQLVDLAASDLAADGCALFSVHTVGPSSDDVPYRQTRDFYKAIGFLPLEEHSNLDWPGPTLILVRDLRLPTHR
jgi:ribosomal protein S18 acetylase RimI-like enzyme